MDPIANMLTSLLNAQRVKKERVALPYARFSEQLARFLQGKGVIGDVRVQEGVRPKLVMTLGYADGRPRVTAARRLSAPGRRQYVSHQELPYAGQRPGFFVISTSQGLMDAEQARKERIGGELVCVIYE